MTNLLNPCVIHTCVLKQTIFNFLNEKEIHSGEKIRAESKRKRKGGGTGGDEGRFNGLMGNKGRIKKSFQV